MHFLTVTLLMYVRNKQLRPSRYDIWNMIRAEVIQQEIADLVLSFSVDKYSICQLHCTVLIATLVIHDNPIFLNWLLV